VRRRAREGSRAYLMFPKPTTHQDAHHRGADNRGTRMAPHELLEIGHHLLRRVLSDVLGRRADLLGSGLRQSSESLATWEMGLAVMNGGRRVRQRTSRRTAILINGVGGSLSDRLRLGRDVDDDGLGRFCDVWRPVSGE
jgi:hypothetical protein